MGNPDLLGNDQTTLYTLIAIFGWSYVGIPLMLFYTGLSQINLELYESARTEGANGFQILRHITIPMLRPTMMVVIMLAVIEALKTFDLVITMTRGGLGMPRAS